MDGREGGRKRHIRGRERHIRGRERREGADAPPAAPQNHKTPELSGSEGASGESEPLPRQGHLEQVTREGRQVGLECPQGGKLHTLPRQLFQRSATLHGRKFFLTLW